MYKRFSTLVILACQFGVVAGQVDLNKGLIAYYPFDGDAFDVSGNQYRVKSVSSFNFVSDRFDNAYSALHLDGRFNQIEINHKGALSTRSGFSFSLEFKTEDGQKIQTLLARRNRSNQKEAQFQVFLNWFRQPGAGYGQHYSNNTDCDEVIHQYNVYTRTGSNTIVVGKWHCLVGTFDGKYQRIYLDGQLMDSVATPLTLADSCSNIPLTIGSHTYYDPQSFVGSIDELRFYNRPLNNEEVRALCNPPTSEYFTFKKSASPFLKIAFGKFTQQLKKFGDKDACYPSLLSPITSIISLIADLILMKSPVTNFR